MPGFSVDPADLGALASSVSAVRDALEATPDLVTDLTTALGSDVVGDALHRFVTGWHDGRTTISTEVGALGGMLAQAATAYADTDDAVAASAGGGDGVTRSGP